MLYHLIRNINLSSDRAQEMNSYLWSEHELVPY